MNAIQYLTNDQGSKTAVVIPIEDWKNLYRYMEQVKNLERIGKSIREGLKEAKMMEAGLISSKESTQDFLDAL